MIRYCAEEVARQRDEPEAVSWMCDAWAEAMRAKAAGEPLSLGLIETFGKLTSPPMNTIGFRQGGVRVGPRVCPPPAVIVASLDDLLKRAADLGPDRTYYEYELIHPFNDGNGRTGKIILNWLNDSLATPIMPSNWFNCANP